MYNRRTDMKKIVVILAAVLSASIALVQAADKSNPAANTQSQSAEKKPALTPEERFQRRQRMIMKRTGGYIDRRMPGSGKFVFVNAQTVVPLAAYEAQVPIISDVFAVEITNRVHSTDVNFANAEAVLKELGGNAGLFVVNQPDAPTLYIAPEKGWAFVNVAALSADKPSDEVLARRVRREVWRGFAMAAGSTDTEWDHCLLGPITSLKSLDNIESEAVSPEPTTKIAKHLTKLGILPFKRITYKQACMEGWAPAPQNEFQQAIWDKVHAVPAKPMKIEFDPKTGK